MNKKIFKLLILAILFSSTAINFNSAQAISSDLFISEYVEGSSGYNKAIEIFNGTGEEVDLSNYSLKKQTNGSGEFGNELVLSGNLANDDVFVVVSNRSENNLADESFVDLATSGNILTFNGNDAVALYKNGIQIDVVGVVDGDPENKWGEDKTLVRKSAVIIPTINYSTNEWDEYDKDTFTYLGSHIVDYDITLPTVSISSTEPNPTNNSLFSVTITFSEEVVNFAIEDIIVNNGLADNLSSSDNIIFTFDLTPAVSGLITVDIAAGTATDSGGNFNTVADQFNITAIDNTLPVITLIGENPVSIEVGAQYTDAGATALDDFDGDITDAIITVNNVDENIVGSYTVTYNAIDIAGNSASEVIRVVNINEPPDLTIPIITLNGGDMNIYQGTIYTEIGATAVDDIDEDVPVVIGGDIVDTAATGIYIITYNASDTSGNKAVEIIRAVEVLLVEANQTFLADEVSLDSINQEVLIGDNAPDTATIIVPDFVTNAQLNVSALLSGIDIKSVELDTSIIIESATSIGDVSVSIPATQISSDSSWTGLINAPQVLENSTVTITPEAGNSVNVSSVIEIGFNEVKLSFDKAVRIQLSGQAGQYVGYSRDGEFTQITNICSSDSQEAGDAMPVDGDCKINVNSDLVIWTKHFTKFITYTETLISGAYLPPSLPTPPEAGFSLIINNGFELTNNRVLTLTLDGGNDAVRMAISSSADFTNISQEAYTQSKEWDLCGKEELCSEDEYTVYAKFYTNQGAASEVVSDSIKTNFNISEVEKVIVKNAEFSEFDSGFLLRNGNNDKVYVISNGLKRHILNPEIFETLGYKWEKVLTVIDRELDIYETGETINDAAVHLERTLIKYQDSHKVYLIEDGKKRWIVSEEIFNENDFNWDLIVEISAVYFYEDGEEIE